MKFEKKLSFTDYRHSTDDHFLEKLSDKLIEERIKRRRSYINVVLVVTCVSLIALNFAV